MNSMRCIPSTIHSVIQIGDSTQTHLQSMTCVSFSTVKVMAMRINEQPIGSRCEVVVMVVLIIYD